MSESSPLAIVCSTLSASSVVVLALSHIFSLSPTPDPPISARFALAVAIPAAALSIVEALSSSAFGSPVVVGARVARVLFPLAAAVVCMRRWAPCYAAPDLRVAAAKEAAVLSRALQGTGVVFSTANVQGMHTVAFFKGDAAPPADAPLSEHDARVPAMVLLPGYGNGSIFWMHNAADLANNFSGRVFALDWLGTGCSQRPDWHARTVREAESFFLDALEAWRETMNARRVILVGHSLGGALSIAAWLRSPQGIAAVIGLSPAGLGGGVFDEAEGGVSPSAPVLHGGRAFAQRPRLRSFVQFLWERCAVTPGMVMRLLGPFARRLARAAVRRRAFRWTLPKAWTEEEMDDIGDYFYNVHCSKGSGEHALTVWFGAGARPRDPLTDRILDMLSAERTAGGEADSSLSVSSASASSVPVTLRERIPIQLAFGEQDWMRRSGAIQAAASLRQAGFDADVVTAPRSGHHLYLENPAFVNAFILRVCEQFK
jgi:cardiolipin-specific phospholipase